MRVLLLTRKHPPAVGGMEKLSAELVQAVGTVADCRVIAWGRSQRWLPLFLVYCTLRTIVEILRWRPDVIHLGDPIMCVVGVPLGAIFGVPTAVTVHGLDVTWEPHWYQRIIVPLVGRCDRVICISSHTLNECNRRGVGDRAVIIPPGFSPESLPAAGEAARMHLQQIKSAGGARSLVLLTVGRVVARKGVAHFIRTALPKIVAVRPEVVYWVAGDGPDMENVRRAIEEQKMHQHVRLFGRVSDEMLGAMYQESHLFVMPNVPVEGDMEGFGLVAVEASLAGLPVIASRLEGISDAVADGKNGHCVTWDDTGEMVQTILATLDRRDRRIFGEGARSYALDKFAWDKIARRYRDAFVEASVLHHAYGSGMAAAAKRKSDVG